MKKKLAVAVLQAMAIKKHQNQPSKRGFPDVFLERGQIGKTKKKGNGG